MSEQTGPPSGVDGWAMVTMRVPGDGSQHIAYLQSQYDSIPGHLLDPLAHVMNMAEMWIASQKEAQA